MDTPIRIGHYRLRRDSGGAGTYRGGLGLEKQFEVLRGELHVSCRGERCNTVPWGLRGGEAALATRAVLRRGDGSQHEITKQDFTMLPGDRFDIATSGGGGHGDPLLRDPEYVLADVIDGKVSITAAADRYGVVISDRDLNLTRTVELRSRLSAGRGQITWIYDRGADGKE
jgi:N-methylhydantoinase B